MPSLVTERIESVKAGILGAGVFALSELIIFFIQYSFVNLVPTFEVVTISLEVTYLIQLAIGMVSGFLFGVTYRYIIRSDRNFHLNDGAVLAFGLVRGLALVENNLETNWILSELLSGLWVVFHSIVCFAIARYILDLAIARKLIKPFVS